MPTLGTPARDSSSAGERPPSGPTTDTAHPSGGHGREEALLHAPPGPVTPARSRRGDGDESSGRRALVGDCIDASRATCSSPEVSTAIRSVSTGHGSLTDDRHQGFTPSSVSWRTTTSGFAPW